MSATIPRHSTAKRSARLACVVLVILLVAAGAVFATLFLGGAGGPDDAPPDQRATSSSGRSPAPPPRPVLGDARVAAPEPDQPVGDGAAAPLGTGAPAPLAEGVLATVRTLTAVRTVPPGAGAESVEGAVVRLDVRNETGEPVELSALTVTATAGDGAVAAPSPGGIAAPLGGPLPGGQSRAGTYVFTLAPGTDAGSLLVRAELAGSPTVVTVRAR